jgi:hypothetical protein
MTINLGYNTNTTVNDQLVLIFQRAGELQAYIARNRDDPPTGELRRNRVQYLAGTGVYANISKDAARKKFSTNVYSINQAYKRRQTHYQIMQALSAVMIERFRELAEGNHTKDSCKAILNELINAIEMFNTAFVTEWKCLGGKVPKIDINKPIDGHYF